MEQKKMNQAPTWMLMWCVHLFHTLSHLIRSSPQSCIITSSLSTLKRGSFNVMAARRQVTFMWPPVPCKALSVCRKPWPNYRSVTAWLNLMLMKQSDWWTTVSDHYANRREVRNNKRTKETLNKAKIEAPWSCIKSATSTRTRATSLWISSCCSIRSTREK